MQLFLTLLRIIGILILAVILLVLLVVLLVLFCPIRYRVIIACESHKSPEAKIRVTWLLHFLSVCVDYREKLSYYVKILGITFLRDDDVLGEKKTAKEKSEPSQTVKSDVKATNTPQVSLSGDAKVSDNTMMPGNAKVLDNTKVSGGSKASDDEKEPAREKVPLLGRIGTLFNRIAEFLSGLQEKIPEKIAELLEKFADFLEKISGWPDTILEKIEALQQKKDKLLKQINDEQNQIGVKAIFSTVGALLKHIRPQKLKASGRLGFDDPATTGQIFGVIGMLMPLYGENIHLEAVFDEAVVEGQIEIKGRIRIGTLLGLAFKLILKKEVRRLIAQVKRLKRHK